LGSGDTAAFGVYMNATTSTVANCDVSGNTFMPGHDNIQLTNISMSGQTDPDGNPGSLTMCNNQQSGNFSFWFACTDVNADNYNFIFTGNNLQQTEMHITPDTAVVYSGTGRRNRAFIGFVTEYDYDAGTIIPKCNDGENMMYNNAVLRTHALAP
jgi:hypothetical protein